MGKPDQVSHAIDESLPEHPPAELIDLFVVLDAAGVAPEDMPGFADVVVADNAD